MGEQRTLLISQKQAELKLLILQNKMGRFQAPRNTCFRKVNYLRKRGSKSVAIQHIEPLLDYFIDGEWRESYEILLIFSFFKAKDE